MGAQSNQSSHEVMKEVTQGNLGNRAAPPHPSLRKQLPCRRSELRDVCPQACLCEEVWVFLNVLGDYFCSFEDSFALMPCWPIIYSVAKTILEVTASGSQVVCPEPPCRRPFRVGVHAGISSRHHACPCPSFYLSFWKSSQILLQIALQENC